VAARLVCPYCYESFSQREIKFRCTGRISRRGRACPRRPDPVLIEHVGRQDALPPVFAGNGKLATGICPVCEDETSHHVCPVCHSQLPLHFGSVPSRIVALIGARETGKTVFMTVLLHELMNRVGARFEASVAGCDESTRARFSNEFEHVLYQRGELMPATRSAAAAAGGLVAPLVFRFTASRRGWLGRSRTNRHLLSFFDSAGEDLASQESVDRTARYLASADGIILLLDPLQFPGARARVSSGSRLPAPAPEATSPLNVLIRVTELLQGSLRLGPGARVAKPLAVSFSKLDALWHSFPEGSPLRRVPTGNGRVEAQDGRDVHEHVRAMLDDWAGPQIDQFLSHNYALYRYFAVSALGETPTADNRVPERGIQPYRVSDPLLWLLAEFGALPN
jgi:Double-GTPase 2